MQNQVQIFESNEFGTVRVVEQEGQPWWVLKDVCKALGLSDARRVSERLDDDELSGVRLHSGGQMRNMYAVNESGLYAVILRSDKPQARAFRKWLTSEVIPAVRRHGAYITADTLAQMQADSNFTEELLERLSAEQVRNSALEERVESLQAKAHYHDTILQSPKALPISVIAKDYGMSAFAFNKLLHELGVQYKVGGVWLLYKEYANCGYTVSKTYLVGDEEISVHTYWTQLGKRFLYSLLEWYGLLPEAERLVS